MYGTYPLAYIALNNIEGIILIKLEMVKSFQLSHKYKLLMLDLFQKLLSNNYIIEYIYIINIANLIKWTDEVEVIRF